ncbi:MAG: single-stranded DNA-binding protein [Bradymonadaceae bacterium]|nr:single-stranded DNA-binding protein [Lujinxingiaceae bacterium]
MRLVEISDQLVDDLADIEFGAPVAFTYQPLDYARAPHVAFLEKYGQRVPREVLLVGMNPGPWGMAQTGVPFGEVNYVRDWMGIEAEVGQPAPMHPARPIEGFGCTRSEVSGSRLWSWAAGRYGSAERFFERFFVTNYCPLLFLNENGSNRTPPQLRKAEREQVLAPCDQALRDIVAYLEPRFVLGVGAWAEERIRAALGEHCPATVGRILHPSPANPAANRGWAASAEAEMQGLGVEL